MASGLFGQEQDHGAILDHHGRPGHMFARVANVAAQIAACMMRHRNPQ
ncbi:MAG: hypothetical protein LR015_14840 [Verrucomicrobia bacterium]|nr:hypothetical protein [Verrucomicrobiota bacterium]